MADNDRPKLSTCPICGYTDTADDAGALQMAIEEHIRLSHNLDPATLGNTGGTVKTVSDATAAEVGGDTNRGALLPVIAAAPNATGSLPGAGTGAAAGTGVGAAVLGANALDDNNANNSGQNRRDD